LLRRHLGFACNLAAFGLFIPGILLPMFILDMEMSALINATGLSTTLVDKELSIISTVTELWHDDRLFVASLIFLFSVCIPLLKTLLVSLAYLKKNTLTERRLMAFVASIGKWSMADVFVVAIFLAVLSTDHGQTVTTHLINILGFKVAFDISTQTLSAAGEGFYFFTGYCLLSLLGTHLSHSAIKPGASSKPIPGNHRGNLAEPGKI
jgi:paraquat-inducible protein A